MEKDNWEKCPRCESNKVQSRGGCFFLVLGLGMLSVSIWLLIIPPVGIVGILIGLLIMFASLFAKGQLQCQDCNFAWKYPYEEKEKE